MGGVDILVIKELLGHREIKMSLRYAHLSPWNLRRATVALCRDWKGEHEDEVKASSGNGHAARA